MITLQEEDNGDYLLTIPAYQRDRAKAIHGYRWDRELRCWRYPKSNDTYFALIAEFGDDLRGARPGPPGLAAPPIAELPQLLDTNLELRTQLKDVQNRLRELKTATRHTAGQQQHTAELESALAERVATASELRSENTALQEKVAVLAAERDELLSRIRGLEAQLSQLQRQHVEVSFPRQIENMAIAASGPNQDFVRLIAEAGVNPMIAMTLTRALENVLKAMLGADRRTGLHDLITQARDAGKLSDDAAKYANTLRISRNIVMHLGADADEAANQARTLVCLFSGALLWRELRSGLVGAPNPSLQRTPPG